VYRKITDENLLENFETNYIPEPNSGCWLWTGALTEGYGVVGWVILGKLSLAHRLSWKLFRGPLADDELVLHSCDVRCCVNPYHLFKGSYKDNTADMMAKGRNRYISHEGEAHGMSKLTEAQAIAIIHDRRTQHEIARDYGVSQTTVGQIKNGRAGIRPCWEHLDAYRKP
jgi:DNA-binding XRE family transcriptional regulator